MTTTITKTPATGHAEHRHAEHKRGAYDRFRDQYEKLPPGVQLIGLQLWLPVFFVIAFCFCYVLAFHAPSPHNIPVQIVSSNSQTNDAVASGLTKSAGGELLVSTSTDLATAKTQVMNGTYAGVYVPGATSSTLYIASGNQYQLATLTKTVFTAVATASKTTLTVDDLAPLPAHDSFGTTLFYVTLATTIGGYMVAMFIGMMGAALRHRTRFAILGGAAIVLPFIVTLITHLIGAVTANFFVTWGIASATAITIGVVVNGLSYFLGRFVTGAALLIFVFMTVPASGGAYPPEFLPGFFRWVHPFVSGTATINLFRHAAYGVGPSPLLGYLLLACYAAVGLILTFVGRPLWVRRQRKAAIHHKRPTMMAAAQMAAMSAGRKAAEEAANSVAAGGGSGASPSDGELDHYAPEVHVETESIRVQAQNDGQLNRDHRVPVTSDATGGPAAAAGVVAGGGHD
ncbi:ABC-2 transporter permease [Frondihabitans cladoniiphilus]|uniref:ABC-type multidrug transport system permease subunit n=1 Tax=Frondihabitans cladoniiphilus TaxID=715785 RepID=A0ABP8WC83_9MICO